MAKCDVIIPVYNAPEYVQICLFALFNNTKKEDLGTVYLLDDKSNDITRNLLDNLGKQYKDYVEVIHNEENLGFVKNVNKGLALSKEKYVLLLNTDCFVANNTIGKLMDHIEKNPKIGLICPMCSNAANLTLKMFPGFSYTMMDKLLEEKFLGQNFDACTVVGNCLMISRDCINKIGYLDEIYGMGYGDETDYQFKAMEAGFEAKAAIDTYVFHKAEQSFNTTNQKRNERIEKNRRIFLERWGDQYAALYKKYIKNDPLVYINNNLTKEDKIAKLDYTFVLPQMGKGTGGIIVINQIINYLSILGLNIGMLNLYIGAYDEIMVFNPLTPKEIETMKSKYLISTIFESIFFTKKLAERIKSKIIYFAQGYEFYFLNGTRYGEVEASFWLADYVITISDYLKNNYNKLFGIESHKVANGIDYNILHVDDKKKNDRPSIIMNYRDEFLKAGFILNDIIKRLTLEMNDLDITVINNSKQSDFCVNNNDTINVNIVNGPIPKVKVHEMIRNSDILVDSSFSEGFGLLPLEAMTVGCVPIVSNAMGNNEYCVNGENSIIIDEVNNVDRYIEEIIRLIKDKKLYEKLQKGALKTSEKYTLEDQMFTFKDVLEDIKSGKIKPIERKMTPKEEEKVKKYLFSDALFDKRVRYCRRMFGDINHKRKRKWKFLAKEMVKSNIYLTREAFEVLKDRDHEFK